MTSIIRVDSIKTAANGTATAASLGIGGTGKIGQVLSATRSVEKTIASTSYTDCDLSISITPSATSSKIFVIVSASVTGNTINGANNYILFNNIVRGSTQLIEYTTSRMDSLSNGTIGATVSLTHLDSPSSTSAVTYKVQQKLSNADNASSKFCFGGKNSTITVMEILA
tara:strand:- start:22 stop:528 length:507 start_codon:yes stop_codon:yes gene_type:complete